MSRAAIIILLVQTACVVIGFLALGMMLKLNGYPEPPPRAVWRTFPVFMRTYGWLLLAVPPLWMWYSTKASRVDNGWLSYAAALVVGGGLAVIIVIGFVAALASPYYYPITIAR